MNRTADGNSLDWNSHESRVAEAGSFLSPARLLNTFHTLAPLSTTDNIIRNNVETIEKLTP